MKFFRLIAISLLVLCASLSRADIVTLRDGTTVEGTIVDETPAEVVIEIRISNIKSIKTIARYKIKSIEYKPIEVNTPADPIPSTNPELHKPQKSTPDKPSPLRTRTRTISKSDRTLVMVIPIEDIIGVEVNAKGLDAALSRASSMGINHVVFDININWKDKRNGKVRENSQLGYYYAAKDCLEVLERYKSEISYYSVIEKKCTPQLLIFLASSKQIFIRPQSTLGARVLYSGIHRTDTANPIFGIEVAALESLMPDILKVGVPNGYSRELLEALLVKESEVWINSEDAIAITDPADGSLKIDDALAPTVLNAEQMERIGFASRYPGAIKNLGKQLDIEHWRVTNGLGARLVRPARDQYEELHSNHSWTNGAISNAMFRLELFDPRNIKATDMEVSFPRDKDGRILYNQDPIPTEMTRSHWRDYSNRAITSADIIIAGIPRLHDISDLALDLGMEHLFYPEYYSEEVLNSVIDARDWIAKNKIFIPRSILNTNNTIPGWKYPRAERPQD
jgi:hypothetical protein